VLATCRSLTHRSFKASGNKYLTNHPRILSLFVGQVLATCRSLTYRAFNTSGDKHLTDVGSSNRLPHR
jgi:hypothetical protein